jgi:hypothetical protein
MRFDPRKSFGYPVLRKKSDDYTESGISASVELVENPKAGIGQFIADYNIMLGVAELKKALKAEKLAVVISFFCPKTLISKRLVSNELVGQTQIDLSDIRGDLHIYVEIVVQSPNFELSSVKIHQEYGGANAKFQLKKGDVIAQADPLKIFIERELFKPVMSLFKWTSDEALETGQWVLDSSGDYVKIQVSPDQLKLIGIKQETADGQALLLNTIFLPAMTRLIDDAMKEQDSELLWSNTILQKLSSLGVDTSKPDNQDYISLAQQLLQYPLRSLNAHFMHED